MQRALCAVLVVAVWHVEAVAQERCEPGIGQVVSAQGRVEIRESETAPWRQAKLGDRLCRGDTIRVGERGRAAVRLINDAVFRLDHNTTLQLVSVLPPESEEPSLFQLVLGAIQSFSRKPRKLAFRTPYLNATIEGTELVLKVGADQSELTLAEGRVLADNAGQSETIGGGEAVVGRRGQAPVRRTVVRPRDAAQWALYYPPVLADGAGGADIVAAAALLEVGRVDEARTAIDRVLARDADAALAYALRSVIRVVQNDKDGALEDARRGVALAPNSAAARIALSYALQARFDLAGARASVDRAVAGEPANALAWARLAELRLMLGDRSGAREAAEKAAGLSPDLGRTQVVLGFTALVEFDTGAAKTAFRKAISLDSADPLPRLGLGLAMIRDGELAEGRAELEIAVGLDATNALLRAYLGKAYFEEMRTPLDSEQFEISKHLDPFDPTPWLYNALRLQTENRPGEALGDLKESIARNENRAVYRGRLQLDQDRAARGASLARIFRDLGFTRPGLNEATRSLTLDPANASAHRFRSDSYGSVRRREIARVSELLQSQMLQDVNVNPVQPSLAETNLNIVTSGGPAEAGFNEFTPLFERNQIQLNVTGEGGSDGTGAGEGVASFVYDQFSGSAGSFYYTTDGFRANSEIRNVIHDVYGQWAINPDLNVQIELRRRETENGDLDLDFDRRILSPDFNRKLDQDTARVGARYSPNSSSDILASFIWSDRDERSSDLLPAFFFGFDLKDDNGVRDIGKQAETQYIYRGEMANLTAGIGYAHVDRTFTTASTLPGFGGLDVTAGPPRSNRDIEQWRGYLYVNASFPSAVTWTAGVSVDDYNEGGLEVFKVNPKAGAQWDVTQDLTVHAAYAQAVKPALAANQTLEPTAVAGMNQAFDDTNATVSQRYGFGWDWSPLENLQLGAEMAWRDLRVPIFTDVIAGTFVKDDRDEMLHRFYVNLRLCEELATSAEFIYDRFRANAGLDATVPLRVRTMSVPVKAFYFHPSGFFAGAGATYVNQEVSKADPAAAQGHSEFALVDASIGYRLPDRRGIISLQVLNVLDSAFDYQDDSFREFQDAPSIGPYIPERAIMLRLNLQL